MKFGDKLKSLRKEHGYSQADFAQQLDITRQAVSKWESGQGYPEIEKLIQISNLFGVTLDYLLKEETAEEKNSIGIYVSKEELDGYLYYNCRKAKHIAIGISIFSVSNIFYYIFKGAIIGNSMSWLLRAIGISFILWQLIIPNNYRQFKFKQLLFDTEIIKTFRIQHNINMRKYSALIIAGVIFLLFSSPIQYILSKEYSLVELSSVIETIMNSAAFGLFFLAGISIKAETLIFKQLENGGCNLEPNLKWISIAIPITILAIFIGFISNTWNPIVPIFVLICIVLIKIYSIMLERGE